jgi:hypothetical protein
MRKFCPSVFLALIDFKEIILKNSVFLLYNTKNFTIFKDKIKNMKTKIHKIIAFLLTLRICFLFIDVHAVTYIIDFNTPSQYTLSNVDQVFVNSGKAQVSELLTQRGQLMNGPNTIENPNQVVVSGNYAYIESYSNGGIQVFDISVPGSPTRVG